MTPPRASNHRRGIRDPGQHEQTVRSRPRGRPRCRCRADRRPRAERWAPRALDASRCRSDPASRSRSASTPVACRSAATSEPLPGNGPRGEGCGIELVATHGHAPIDRDRALGEQRPVGRASTPVRPPAGVSAVWTGRQPCSRRASMSPVVPTTRTVGPGRKPIGEIVRRRLGRGDHLVGRGRHPSSVSASATTLRRSGQHCW